MIRDEVDVEKTENFACKSVNSKVTQCTFILSRD